MKHFIVALYGEANICKSTFEEVAKEIGERGIQGQVNISNCNRKKIRRLKTKKGY